jgi:hypothetical protein
MPSTPAVAQPPPQRARADAITRNAVTLIIAITALVSFVFSFGNVTLLCLSVGIPRTIAWLVSPAVDLSVTGLLLATNALVQRRPASGHSTGMRLWKPRLMLGACGLLTLALNTAGPATHHRLGAALVSAVLPALLLGWSEVGPSLLHELYAIPQAAPGNSQAADRTDDEKAAVKPIPATPPLVPAGQVAKARTLDAEHRQANRGRPISRDSLRTELGCSTNRASAIINIIRAVRCPEANAAPGTLRPLPSKTGHPA